jgi:subtilisin family serine protease
MELQTELKKSAMVKQRVFTDDPIAVVSPRGAKPSREAMMIATHTLIVEGARTADLEAARNAGATVLDEGLDGKALLACPSVHDVFAIAELLTQRHVGAAVPNFIRRITRPRPGAKKKAWAASKIKLAGAWKITKGDADVAIAVLDEGVDTKHPALKSAVVAEKDFIGKNGNSAMPEGDDAHGTCCAGVAVSRHKDYPGIAPKCSLIAARIAMGGGDGNWMIDDYSTAEAIDWCWRKGAAVLSNSWGGGLPSDAVSRALGRARTQGRKGKGAVVVMAAGNHQVELDFPSSLPGYVTVGASNNKDERKTKDSSDGEINWGSNFGDEIWLVAPGVFIHTTDIVGAPGKDRDSFIESFNGTSAATPHVAAAAALMISANPKLTASDVRLILRDAVDPIEGQTEWTPELGHGRLNVEKAVKLAKKF